MSEWKKVKLDDCLELITYGFTNPMPDTLSGPWKVTAKDINNGRIVYETARHTSQEAFENDLTDKSRPKKGDILLTKDGTLGRLAIVGDERVCINQSVALLRVNKNILSVPYLYYLLSTPLYQAKMLADAGGAAIKHIYITRVNQLLIPCPSYDEQCRIANILSRYDSLIENYQKQIKLLEEAAQRLYKEWFVDLHFPGHEHTKIVNGVPEGWEKKKIRNFVELQSGYAFKSSTFEDGCPYKIVTIKNVKDGVFEGEIVSTVRTVPEKMPNHCFLKDGDILLSLTGNVGRVCMVIGENYLLNQRVAKLKSDYPAYTYSLFRSHEMFITICNLANGAAQQNVSPIRIGDIDIVMANDELMKKFEGVAGVYVDEIIKHYRQIRLLTEARDRLLPKLMNGELAV